MARRFLHALCALVALSTVQAYFLVGNRNILVSERLDPIINPGAVSGHTHSIIGGSNFGPTLSTDSLRDSNCTSMPVQEDRSNYWFPHLYFQHKNGSFSSLTVGVVVYYLFNDAEAGKANTVQAFPDNLRMISGDMTLRSYNASSYAQQAITFLCLDFNGVTTKYNSLPPVSCPSGVRAQINFPMCWDGKNLDSTDHKSHMAFPSGGPDSGTCSDPNYPVTVPRVFVEGYWSTGDFDKIRNTDAMNSTQPYVFAHGDPTGYGYHADFFNGWKSGVLQNVLDKCACTTAAFGDATCCGDLGVFTLETSGSCSINAVVEEQVLGTLKALPGNNPVRSGPAAAAALAATTTPAISGSTAKLSVSAASSVIANTSTLGTSSSSSSGAASISASDSGSSSSEGTSTSTSISSSFSSADSATASAIPAPADGFSSSSSSASITTGNDAVVAATGTLSSSVSSSTDSSSSAVLASSSTGAPATSPTGISWSSNGHATWEDNEYEYFCEKRPKKNSARANNDFSKARRQHNHHRRVTNDAF